MGHSQSKGEQAGSHHSSTVDMARNSEAAPSPAPSPAASPAASKHTVRLPKIIGDDPASPLSVAGRYQHVLESSLLEHIPQSLRVSWRILYSTTEGRSFPRLVRSICQAGPCLLVMELLGPSNHGTASSQRTLLCSYTGASWLSMADRRGAGRDPATEKRQSAGFFGDSSCIISSHWNLEAADPESFSCIRKPSVKSNALFMFLVDEGLSIGQVTVTPGIGMGGPVGRHAWALDEDLEVCRLCPRCSTFDGPPGTGFFGESTSDDATYQVLCLQVYSLDERRCPPEVRREAERKAIVKSYVQDVYGGAGNGGQRSILEGNEASAIKAVLELAGAHSFHHEHSECS